MTNPNTVLVEGMIFAAGKSGVEHKFVLEKIPAIDKRELEEIIAELQRKYPDDGTSGIVLKMRQLEHRELSEIAEILGIQQTSVSTLLSRARNELLNKLKRRNQQ